MEEEIFGGELDYFYHDAQLEEIDEDFVNSGGALTNFFSLSAKLLVHGSDDLKLTCGGNFIWVDAISEIVYTESENAFSIITEFISLTCIAQSETICGRWVHELNQLVRPKKGSKNMARLFGFANSTGNIKQDDIVDKDGEYFYSIELKVSEAKDMRVSSKSELRGIVCLENGYGETRTIAGENPLWAEDFEMILHDIYNNNLKIFIWDFNSDKCVGKMDLELLPFVNLLGSDEWFPLVTAKNSEFVTGTLTIRVEINMGQMIVTVVEGRNLPRFRTKGNNQVYVKINYGDQELKTKPKKMSNSIYWADYPKTFDFNPNVVLTLRFTILVTSRVKTKTICIGKGIIKADELTNNNFLNKTIVLGPDDKAKDLEHREAGNIRCTVKVKRHRVFEQETYTDLIEYFLDNPLGVILLFEACAANERGGRIKVARSLVRIFESKNRAYIVLCELLTREAALAQGVDTLFRANSVGSKAIDMYMQAAGKPLLGKTIKSVIERIFNEKQALEIDNYKPKESKKNLKSLQAYIDEIMHNLAENLDSFPDSLRFIFKHLTEVLYERFPEEENIKYIGISGFLFLRLICAAILGPKLFGLSEDHPNQKINKSLATVSKTLVKIAGMVPFEIRKEGVEGELESYIESKMPEMKDYMDAISTFDEDAPGFFPLSVDLPQELSSLFSYLESHLETDITDYYHQNPEEESLVTDIVQILDNICVEQDIREPYLPILLSKEPVKEDKNEQEIVLPQIQVPDTIESEGKRRNSLELDIAKPSGTATITRGKSSSDVGRKKKKGKDSPILSSSSRRKRRKSKKKDDLSL
eukprot:TRINITY_DN713_c0_g1_i1.p1 TRINITY_DN713_c0_g1~~TRINITY_DN713_c0_g1_i1.p1  ORF type:complete len:828 (+),score=213.95 TRINITY_DN713_c0_g1_i1:48-2486(+)